MPQMPQLTDMSHEANSALYTQYRALALSVLKRMSKGEKVIVSTEATKHKLNRKTLAKHLKAVRAYRQAEFTPVGSPKKLGGGRPPYISPDGVQKLNLMLQALDVCGRPCTQQMLLVLMKKIKIHENPDMSPEEVGYPSKSTASRIVPQLTVPLRSLRAGEGVRQTKSKEHYLAETYAKIRSLDNRYHFLDEDKWNLDEMGISFTEMGVKVFTTVKNARRERMSAMGHTTVCVATNAAGGVGPPFFLHQGVEATSVPTAAFERRFPIYTAHTESAFMTKDLFEQYIIRFVAELHDQHREQGNIRPTLLVVDGHCSRLNPDLLFHCAVNSVVVLELPSHLTHLLQPNDAVVNRYIKDVVRERFQLMVAAGIKPTNVQLSGMVLEALQSRKMRDAILASWKHCGLCPLDETKAASLVKNEKVADALISDPTIQFVTDTLREALESLTDINQRVLAEMKATPKQKGRPSFVCQRNVQVLTDKEQIAWIMLSNDWRDIKKMKAQELHDHMAAKYPAQELINMTTLKFKSKDTLVNMEYERLLSTWNDLCSAIETRMALYNTSRLGNVDQLIIDMMEIADSRLFQTEPADEVMESGCQQ